MNLHIATFGIIFHSQACKVREGEHKDDALEAKSHCSSSRIDIAIVNAFISVIAFLSAMQRFRASEVQEKSKDECVVSTTSTSSKSSETWGETSEYC